MSAVWWQPVALARFGSTRKLYTGFQIKLSLEPACNDTDLGTFSTTVVISFGFGCCPSSLKSRTHPSCMSWIFLLLRCYGPSMMVEHQHRVHW